jgi:hypothetical protein
MGKINEIRISPPKLFIILMAGKVKKLQDKKIILEIAMILRIRLVAF